MWKVVFCPGENGTKLGELIIDNNDNEDAKDVKVTIDLCSNCAILILVKNCESFFEGGQLLF